MDGSLSISLLCRWFCFFSVTHLVLEQEKAIKFSVIKVCIKSPLFCSCVSHFSSHNLRRCGLGLRAAVSRQSESTLPTRHRPTRLRLQTIANTLSHA